MQARPKILIICDFYLPGYESGGAVRTLANMIDRLGDRYDFRVVTRDRDGVAIDKPYDSVDIGDWNSLGNASVFYLAPNQVRLGMIRSLITEVDADAIYVNSFFSPLTIMCILLERTRQIKRTPIILAPEGEFSSGALKFRRIKKLPYLAGSKALLLSNRIIWKAASDAERKDIEHCIGSNANITVAPNMPPRIIFAEYDPIRRRTKCSGEARMIFLSRFMRKKNFNWLIPLLAKVEGKISINICGTLEEKDYWDECRRLTANLPERIEIESIGPVPHGQVQEKLADYDFFVLPTLGENFGHVFIEAFASGLPVIISDQTPWRDLRSLGIGWDLSLDRPDDWITTLNHAIRMGASEHRLMCQAARTFALKWLADPEIEGSNIAVLEKALASGRSH